MTIRDNETATDADLLSAGTGLVQVPGAAGFAVVGPAVAASQRRLREDRARGSRPLTSRRWFVVAGGAILPVLLLAAWQIATTSGLVSVAVFPSPAMVWAAGVDLAQRGDLGQDVAISTQRVLIGFALGSALGLLVGAMFGLSRVWEVVLGPTLGAIRAVPSLAWVPLLLLWLGIGEESKITLITIGAFFPVFTTVATALGHVDRHLVEAGRAFGLSGVRLFTTVQLPAVIPAVISGLRLALAQSWLFLVASELIASSMGLGFRLIDSQNNGRIDRVFLAIILLAVLGKLTDAVVGVFQRYAVRKWA
ncbi:nitrate ABC transporter permease [Rathayibacter tritici]|uniref:ABC transporter permease n=1 Tax=Rathayibacter tritici TaxID=33888 RepID=UPI000CE7EA93|nr:ABC transporter permease [Rathayibacter tritici]PPF27976.1 nitrate ABC transporter permease [Rathayibacter tritici]PPF65229.1 nitrate ABC transporter permease [Rathayibacter tritici]PPG04835.1 nitrate ABC transporter permease [Rathayibacter tritici]PPI18993.1 nitrate ABC transporter permease [Rathayibacter tritici]